MNVLQNKELERSVSGALLKVGVPPSAKGFVYLRRAVCLALESDAPLTLSRDIYPVIAEYFSVTPASVERAIRLAIGSAVDRGRYSDMDEVLRGGCSSSDTEKPRNAEFIFGIAEYIRNKIR